MNVLAIHGSYHKNGNISKLVDFALEGAKEGKAEQVEKIALLDKSIQFCKNCMTCWDNVDSEVATYRCSTQDDMQGLIDRIDQADHFILASPVNVGTVTALFKRFSERCVAASTMLKVKDAIEKFPEMLSELPPTEQIPPELLELPIPLPRTMLTEKRKAIVITSAACPPGIIEKDPMLDRTFGVLEDTARILGFIPFKRVTGAGITILPAGHGNPAEEAAFKAGKCLGG